MPIQFNVIISGVSVSGDIDTLAEPVRVALGDSDKVGFASFALQNRLSTYTKQIVSGNATCQIDAMINGVANTIFRGTVERAETEISVKHGSVTKINAYDLGQELLGVISPDARPASVIDASTNVVSGEQGIAAPNGIDLANYVSGMNFSSGAALSDFMSQWFGRSGDFSGSFSGQVFSLKPWVSGYAWKTYYLPDASGFVGANDKNANYYVPYNTLKARHEYGWDILRKLTRQAMVIDSAGNKVAFESYVDISGGIHIFTSGSYEFLMSGSTGQLAIQYYPAGASGSALNNIIEGKIPFDVTPIKNIETIWFPPYTSLPTDQDLWTDMYYFTLNSGGSNLSAISGRSNTLFSPPLSGHFPAPAGVASTTSIGKISIMARGSGFGDTTPQQSIVWTFSGVSANGGYDIQQFNISGRGYVSLTYAMRYNISGSTGTTTKARQVRIIDTSGNYIDKANAGIPGGFTGAAGDSGWFYVTDIIFTASGTLLSGNGTDGYTFAPTATLPDFTRISQIRITASNNSTGPAPPNNPMPELFVDNLAFTFNYQFGPILVQNSGSSSIYGRRYAVLEYPYGMPLSGAISVANNELNTRMGQKGVGEFVVKDNPLLPPIQMTFKPGRVFVVDAPVLNTGSGQTFYYWKAIEVTHEWSAMKGLYTMVRAVPWFSGTLVDPNRNFVDYQQPLAYKGPQPATRNAYMPVTYPYLNFP